MPIQTYKPMDIFQIKPLEEWIDIASKQENPAPLWLTLWFEHEVACLFADTNMGKSIYSVQIAESLARQGHRVLYFDFEMSAKQMQMRYTSDDGRLHQFSENFFRAEFDQVKMPDSVEEIVQAIGRSAREHDCRIIIIDNITWICNRSESGDAAGELMQLLIGLKRDMDLSVLCLAHTPKRAQTSALTQNSLAGSKRIANFMDSIFAIGMDYSNAPQGRYIKQIKVRNDEMRFGADNVIQAQIQKQGDFLEMTHVGFANEESLLVGDNLDEQRSVKDAQIRELLIQGHTQDAICQMLHVSKRDVSKTNRTMKAEKLMAMSS